MWIIGMIIIGLVAGYIARALVPGSDAMGIGATLILGLVGSLIGGFLGYVLFGRNADGGMVQFSSWFGSIIGSIIALLIWRRVGSGRSRTA